MIHDIVNVQLQALPNGETGINIHFGKDFTWDAYWGCIVALVARYCSDVVLYSKGELTVDHVLLDLLKDVPPSVDYLIAGDHERFSNEADYNAYCDNRGIKQ